MISRGSSIAIGGGGVACGAGAGVTVSVCVDVVESGRMTKDLAILIGPNQPWLNTQQFLDKIDANLKKALA